MDKKRVIIELPLDLSENVEPFGPIDSTVTVVNNKVQIALLNKEKEPLLKNWWILLPTVLMTIVFIVMNYGRKAIALAGDNSIASYVITIGVILSFVLFTYFFVLGKKGKIHSNTQDIYWRNFPSILISLGLIIVVVLLVVFNVVEKIFLGVTFDLFTASTIFAIIIGVLSYLVIMVAIKITPSTLINMLMLIAIGGVGIAMLTNSEQQWWLTNLSYLGSNFATSSWRFNLTLILAAFIMIALIDFLFEAIFKVQPRSNQLRFMKFLLVMMAIFLGNVGVFPYNESAISRELHNVFAQGLVFWVLILMGTARWLLPVVDKEFLRLTNIMAGLLVIITILFMVVRYLSLTAFEIMAFVVAFSWLLLLLQKLIQLSNYGSQTYSVTIEVTE